MHAVNAWPCRAPAHDFLESMIEELETLMPNQSGQTILAAIGLYSSQLPRQFPLLIVDERDARFCRWQTGL